MNIIFQILFWVSVTSIFHSYVLFPIILKVLSKKKQANSLFFQKNEEELPYVSILMSVYNEENVIERKLQSIIASNYPSSKFEILIGSDASTDLTNKIISSKAKTITNLKFHKFEQRQGKPKTINLLENEAKGSILIITDANVFFSENTIFEMVKHFKNKFIGLVDSQLIIQKDSVVKNGISIQESSYISREIKIKQHEGNIWGTMMGPFGGCYSIRKELYKKVPDNFLVDDFYINLNVLKQGFQSISSKESFVYEDASSDIKEEFRRKVRISTGNFQNLFLFKHLIFSRIKGLSFNFISHKIIRWLGPFLILTAILSLFFLVHILFYKIMLIIFAGTIAALLFDLIFLLNHKNFKIIRFISHFYSMNLALMFGFFKYIAGVKSGIWKPTNRNQYQK